MTPDYRASELTHLSGCCNEIQFTYSCYICDEVIACQSCNVTPHECPKYLSTGNESYPHPVEHAQDYA